MDAPAANLVTREKKSDVASLSECAERGFGSVALSA